ncbi:hypothetical protein P12x_005668 [Tundrisphaera lichenicola]|uniref:hypothetical protein n=1 Tax=Tundrisphaera lichenicola TaxID=2029860 RepID=UPI003EBEA931
MSRTIRFATLFLLGSMAGCEPTAPESNLLGAAPHGGVSFVFPNKKGSVEIGVERKEGASKGPRLVTAYFYGPDGTTPLATAPTDVKIAQGSLPPIPLTQQDLPGKEGRFASAPGPYSDEIRGVLEATVEGEKVEVPFARR